MYLPTKVITFINNLPDRTIPVESLFGFMLTSGTIDPDKLNQENINKAFNRMKKFPPAVIVRYAESFTKDYMNPVMEEYNIKLAVPNNTEEIPVNLSDFHSKYGNQVVIQELNLVKYFDSLMDSEEDNSLLVKKEGEGEVGNERLLFKVRLKEESENETEGEDSDKKYEESVICQEFALISQEDSIARLSLAKDIAIGFSKKLFFVNNVISFILKHPENLTDEKYNAILNEDLAKLNALGHLSEVSSRVVLPFLDVRFNNLSKNFF